MLLQSSVSGVSPGRAVGGAGAGHGGQGGLVGESGGGMYYGSVGQPLSYGSPAAVALAPGSPSVHGGGIIKMEVSQDMQLDGMHHPLVTKLTDNTTKSTMHNEQ